MQRATKSNNIPSYSCALFQTIIMLLTTNQHAGLMSLYAIDLLKINKENPAIYQMLQDGVYSVNRTGNTFAEVGIDRSLEHTINASAKNRI